MGRRRRSPKFTSSTTGGSADEAVQAAQDQPASAPAEGSAESTGALAGQTDEPTGALVSPGGGGFSDSDAAQGNGNGAGEPDVTSYPEMSITMVADRPSVATEPDEELGEDTASSLVDDAPDGPATEPGDDASDDNSPLSGDDASDEGPAHSPGAARRSRQRAIRTALATLPVPDPEPGFWAGLDVAMAEQKPLAITARPAIRPITEPPPLSQPRPGDDRPDSALRVSSRSSRDGGDVLADKSSRRKLLLVICAFVVGLLVVGSTLADDGSGPTPEGTTTSTLPGEVTTTRPAETTTSLAQIRGLDTTTVMTPAGVGPLEIGARLADVDPSVERIVDQSTFSGSGGTCFDVRLPAMFDLTLRYRSPDPDRGVGDPNEGVLASVTISTQVGSNRGTEAAMGLLAPAADVREAHRGSIDVIDDPYLPGGEIYLVPAEDGSGNGVAYRTDGSVVTAISAGALDTISSPQPCI